MKGFLLLLIAFIIMVSGCIQTGQVSDELTQEEEQMLDDILEESPEEPAEIQDEPSESQEVQDPCEGVVCPHYVSICPDGFRATCSTQCLEGSCTECTPDCSGHEPEDINITMVLDPQEEWVKIWNFGTRDVDFTNWTLNDTLAKPRLVFTFPDFTLRAGAFVYVLKGKGQDSADQLYRQKDNNVWNNDGDTAVLINKDGKVMSSYSY